VPQSAIGLEKTEEMAGLTGNQEMNLSDNIFCERFGSKFFLYDRQKLPILRDSIFIKSNSSDISPFGNLSIETCKNIPCFEKSLQEGITEATIPVEEISGLVLSASEKGDLYHPYKGSEKRFTQFTRDKGFPRFLRRSVPVLSKEGTMLWALGAGISESAKIDPKNQIKHLRLKIDGDWAKLCLFLRERS
jgi:hypothetical protein